MYRVFLWISSVMCTSALALDVGGSAFGSKPHILHILLDDFGWADAGWHSGESDVDEALQSPRMNDLVKQGVELDRHYAYKFCSPTRSAIQSGRNPIHVNVVNTNWASRNPEDPVSGYMGIPRNMTCLAEHMGTGGYETHFYGKWDAGMATPEHTPQGRGYEHSLHFFAHYNDYWNSQVGQCGDVAIVDLWEDASPAAGQNNSGTCSQERQEGCVYEDQLFLDRVLDAIENRSPQRPLFIFWAPHVVHEPLEVPLAYLERFSSMEDDTPEQSRRFYHAMVYWLDEAVGQVVDKLKDEGLWDNTLVVLHSDNGGAYYEGGKSGGSNYPLRGGKMSNFEGGIRVNALASGGFLPEAQRGTKSSGLSAGWDWYATYSFLAGVEPVDDRATQAGLPPHDSYNLWPLLSGASPTSPRTELAIGDNHGKIGASVSVGVPGGAGATHVGGLFSVIVGSRGIARLYKLVTGTLTQNAWAGQMFPNASTATWDSYDNPAKCGTTPETGCLYLVEEDPSEYSNVAAEKPQIFQLMLARMQQIENGEGDEWGVLSPDRGTPDPKACEVAVNEYGGFWGPFHDVDSLRLRSTPSQLV